MSRDRLEHGRGIGRGRDRLPACAERGGVARRAETGLAANPGDDAPQSPHLDGSANGVEGFTQQVCGAEAFVQAAPSKQDHLAVVPDGAFEVEAQGSQHRFGHGAELLLQVVFAVRLVF